VTRGNIYFTFHSNLPAMFAFAIALTLFLSAVVSACLPP
jgi:hypothetical protein